MIVASITYIASHGSNQGLGVGSPLRGFLDGIPMFVCCTCHTLVHGLSDDRVVTDNSCPRFDLVDPSSGRLLAEEVSSELYLLECNFSTELDVG